jgi:NAD(P)-dependent dehydrogenase (short-subunit alcohol dehydrogenase family)
MNDHSNWTITHNHRLQTPSDYNNRVAVVTGSSSGIGLETAILLARSGFHTYASMRNLEKSRNIITEIANTEKNLPLTVVQLNVNDDRSVKDAISQIVAEKGRIDVLVNNAGYGLFSPIEDVTLDEVKEQFETNFFGVVRVTKEVLPIMRKQRKGTIVNVSSAAGRVGIPVLSAYVATKFALEGLSESISYELEPFGIRVVIIEPGFIRTNIMNSRILPKKALDPKSPYFSLTQKIESHFKSMVENASSSSPPEEVAKVIVQAITSEDPQPRYIVGDDATTLIQARMNMSDKEFENWMYENLLQQQQYVFSQERG